MNLPRDKDYVVDVQVGDPDLLRLLRGNIVECPFADAIVNAANSDLLPGAGVCGAIHRAGGPAIAENCCRIRAERGSIPPGEAVATTAGRLPNKYVIHAVGPIWSGGNSGESETLANSYRKSMRIADELGVHSIAFPAISTGVYGYPVEKAAWVAVPTLIECLRAAKKLVFVAMILFDKATLDVFTTVARAQRKPASGNPYDVFISES
ncbi:MAG TPA: macro domain-containing protein [Terriglobales bacterium]|nr:macro domain-containing protein [Terriglobales bacterium]